MGLINTDESNLTDFNDTSCSEQPLQSGCSSVFQEDYFIFYLVHCTALAQISVSILSGIIVIVCIIVKRRQERLVTAGRGGFSERFPLYVAINDLIWGICHAIDHTLLITTQVYPSKIVVIIISSVNYFAFAYQQLMYAAVSVYTYFSIVKGKSLNLGRWEWKLTLGCLTFVGLCTVILQRQGALGIGRYWILAAEDGHQWIYQVSVSTLSTTIQALTTIFAYAFIKKTVQNNKSRVESASSGKDDDVHDGPRKLNSSSTSIQNGYHDTASRCLSTFVAIGIFLYLPLALTFWASIAVTGGGRHDLFKIDRRIGIIFTFLFLTFGNCGGFVNGIGYFRNNWIKKKRRKDGMTKSFYNL